MFEKVNPCHPDKVADRIAGALVDAAYRKEENPRIAVEVLIGHGVCHIIAETSVSIPQDEVESIVQRIAGNLHTDYLEMPQDGCLANNQAEGIRCGDNGIFKGVPVTEEQKALCEIAKSVYHTYPSDGKYIIDEARLILCQSNAPAAELRKRYPGAEVNPLGDWTGGTDVDSGATNRKLGSDMADSVTGGGLHGKDLSKADVSVNIYAWLKAQETGKPVELCCAIGEDTVELNIMWAQEKGMELPSKIYLFQGLPKSDKMELIIQKAVELGVYEIIPMATARAVVKLDQKKAAAKVKRWQAISESAAKQSKRLLIPEVKEPVKFSEALKLASDLDVRLIPYELAEGMDGTRRIIQSVKPGQSVAVFIGPEGGFEEAEVELAKEAGFQAITLGRRILRTETAGMTVLSILMYQLEEN